MSVLILVRHGQASFSASGSAADYDRLSEVGRQQARLLGAFWARRGFVPNEVYTGPRSRQRQTAELAGIGGRWPEPVVVPDLDEFDLEGLVHGLAPELARRDRDFAEMLARYRQSADEDSLRRNFQKAFERLTGHWVEVAHACEGLETWPMFRERVRRALGRVLDAPGRGRRVAVFTSGGVIGTAVQLALAAPDRLALEMSWRVRNGSLSEFVFTRDRLTLDGFNAVPHLDEPALWTYR